MTQVKKLIKYPSTEQFRTIVKNVSERASFVGLDENGKAMYDPSLKKPVIKFKGTVKLHGTNAGVSLNNTHGLWAQSKENILTIDSDNYGFAFFVYKNEEFFANSLKEFAAKNNIDLNVNTITVYGEWAGESIQKGMGISNHPKSFFVFGVKVSKPGDEDFNSFWIDAIDFPRKEESMIYNIQDFETYEIEVDFNRPDLAQNKMVEIMLQIEEECPVAKKLGYTGIGEGTVWTFDFKGNTYRFKVKGEKHAGKTKVKTLKVADSEKIGKIHEVANKVTPAWRLDQMLTLSCNLGNGGNIDRAKLGDYLRMVINDVMKEDADIIADAGLEPKDVNKYVSQIAREYFFDREREDLGVI